MLRGSFRVLFLYDVAEAIDLGKLREMLGPRSGKIKEQFPRRTPDYIRFEQPPIAEPSEQVTLQSGEQVVCTIKYYSFASVVVQMDVPFECDWKALVCETSRWVDPTDIEPQARRTLRHHLEKVRPAIIKPTKDWLEEDYLIINVQGADADASELSRDRKAESIAQQHSGRKRRVAPVDLNSGFASTNPATRTAPLRTHSEQSGSRNDTLTSADGRLSGEELLASHGQQIAQMVRGESAPLAARTTEEILQASASYYPSDLTVIGSAAAFVYDRPEDAAATSQVLEYAKMQLLEFRYYDGLMTQLLSDVYAALEQSRNVLLSRWSFPRQAKRFNTIRLDVMELTERIDNAIKFVSDIYYARVYRLAATRMGVDDYRNLVDEKLRTVRELHDFMTDQFNEARSFVVELGIAILALLDVILLLKGFGGFSK